MTPLSWCKIHYGWNGQRGNTSWHFQHTWCLLWTALNLWLMTFQGPTREQDTQACILRKRQWAGNQVLSALSWALTTRSDNSWWGELAVRPGVTDISKNIKALLKIGSIVTNWSDILSVHHYNLSKRNILAYLVTQKLSISKIGALAPPLTLLIWKTFWDTLLPKVHTTTTSYRFDWK